MWEVLAGAAVCGLLCGVGAWVAPRWMEVPPRRWEQVACAVLGLGLGAALAGYQGGLSPAFARSALLAAVLVTASLVDLHDRIIPNELMAFTAIAWPLLQLIAPTGPAVAGVGPGSAWWNALLGSLAGGGLLLGLALLYPGGMGMGDVKLAGAFGLYLGWPGSMIALFLAFILGGVISVALIATRRIGRKQHIPFGPFLALGALIVLIWGQLIWNSYWYVS